MNVLDYVTNFRYLAMFGILFLCGTGLPIPEEVTLVTSGLMVGWGNANFWLASIACVAGILAGDCIIFGLGHHFGQRFLDSRFLRLLLSSRKQAKVAAFFSDHGNKAVFFARFFVGVRIGVYAYAGSQKMRWSKFLFLDLLGALISGPTSIFLGKLVAEHLVDRDKAVREATRIVNEFGHWLLLGVLAVIVSMVAVHQVRKRRRLAARKPAPQAAPPAPVDPTFVPPALETEVDLSETPRG